MSRLPPFTLIHSPGGIEPQADERLEDAQRACEPEPRLVKRWASLNESLQRTLWASSQTIAPDAADQALVTMVKELDQHDNVETVGVWDLNAEVGFLPQMIARLNAAQPVFAFFVVQAAVPAGLVSRPARMIEWAKEKGVRVTKQLRAELEENIIADDFFPRARSVRDKMGLSILVGVCGKKIAFSRGENVCWNYFSSAGAERLSLVSTADLRRFAEQAGSKYETAVARVMISSLLIHSSPRLGFHRTSHGTPCAFDFHEDRVSIVDSFKSPAIHPDCLAKIPLKYRAAADAFVAALRE